MIRVCDLALGQPVQQLDRSTAVDVPQKRVGRRGHVGRCQRVGHHVVPRLRRGGCPWVTGQHLVDGADLRVGVLVVRLLCEQGFACLTVGGDLGRLRPQVRHELVLVRQVGGHLATDFWCALLQRAGRDLLRRLLLGQTADVDTELVKDGDVLGACRCSAEHGGPRFSACACHFRRTPGSAELRACLALQLGSNSVDFLLQLGVRFRLLMNFCLHIGEVAQLRRRQPVRAYRCVVDQDLACFGPGVV